MTTETKHTIAYDIGHSRIVHAILIIACVGLLNQMFEMHKQAQEEKTLSLSGYAATKKMDSNTFQTSQLALPKGMMPTHGFNTCTSAPAWDNCEGMIVDFDAGTIQDYALAWSDRPEDRKFAAGAPAKLSKQDFNALVSAANRDWNPGAPVPWKGGWTTGICSVQLFDGETGRNDDFAPSCVGSAVLDVLDKIEAKNSQSAQ